MSKFFSAIVISLALSAAAFAGPCLQGSLQSYVDLEPAGCELGAVSFSNFSIVPGLSFASVLDPTLVQVTPGGSSDSPNLLFSLNSSALTGELFQSIFRFNAVGGLLGFPVITLNSPAATGDGVVTGILDVCSGGSFQGDPPVGCTDPASAVAFYTANGSTPREFVNGTFSSFFDVFVDLTVDGGLQGTAFLPSATVGLSAVPEPSAMILTAMGLAAVGVLRRRRTL